VGRETYILSMDRLKKAAQGRLSAPLEK
jgi:hypothetical protein